MRFMFLIFVLSSLVGCGGGVGVVRMMPRDSGNVFMGKVVGDGVSTATMDITIDGENYSGLFVAATSNESFRLATQFGPKGGVTTGIATSSGGTRSMVGILSSSNGRGLRCEITATGRGGAGICADDKSRIFDAIVSRE